MRGAINALHHTCFQAQHTILLQRLTFVFFPHIQAMSYDAGVVNPVAGVFDDPFMGDDGSTDHFAGDSSFMFLRVSQCSVRLGWHLCLKRPTRCRLDS